MRKRRVFWNDWRLETQNMAYILRKDKLFVAYFWKVMHKYCFIKMNILTGYRLALIPKNPFFYNIIGLANKLYLKFEGEKILIFIAKSLKKALFSGFFVVFFGGYFGFNWVGFLMPTLLIMHINMVSVRTTEWKFQ